MSSEQANRRLRRWIGREGEAPSEEGVQLRRKLEIVEIAANTAGLDPGSRKAERKKDKIAVASLIKTTGHNEYDCNEFLAMNKLEGVSTIQAYYKAHQMLLGDEGTAAMAGTGTGAGEEEEAAAMAGTGTGSGSGAGTGAGSGEPAYSAELTAEPATDQERIEDKREEIRTQRTKGHYLREWRWVVKFSAMALGLIRQSD